MKKILPLVALTIASCKQSDDKNVVPVVPVSTLNISYDGKTCHITNADTASTITAETVYTSVGGKGKITAKIIATNGHTSCNFGGLKLADLRLPTGTYKCGSAYTYIYYSLELIDRDDSFKRYQTDYTGNDTTSTINVTVSNANQVKGTFNLILSRDGVYYPATGDFDYHH